MGPSLIEQLPLRMRLRESARFTSFVVGENAQACAALQGSRPAAPPVVWLWGRPGSGKSHLLQAACAAASERGDAPAYIDLTLAPAADMLEGCDALGLVCLDGLDAVAADPSWNAALFRLHTLLQDGTGRLVVSSTSPPAALSLTLPDLRSRLLAADIYLLGELDEAGQCEALRLRAAARGMELSEDAALYLVRRLPRDMHSLFTVLDQLDAASLAAQRRLTVPFLRDELEKKTGDRS